MTSPASTPTPAAPARLRPPQNSVSPRAIIHWGLEYLLGWSTVFLITWSVTAWLGPTRLGLIHDLTWLPRAVALVGTATTVIAPCWRYRVHRWEVAHDVVYTRTGWFTRHWLLVPVSRIQTVDAEQGLIERLLGLATLKVSTASHAGSSKITGLPAHTATSLAATLAHRAHTLRDDAT